MITTMLNDNPIVFTNELIKRKNYIEIMEVLNDHVQHLILGERNIYRLISVFTQSDQPLIKYKLLSQKEYLIKCTRKEFRYILTSLIDDPSKLNCICIIKMRQLFNKEEFDQKVNSICLEEPQLSFLNAILLLNDL